MDSFSSGQRSASDTIDASSVGSDLARNSEAFDLPKIASESQHVGTWVSMYEDAVYSSIHDVGAEMFGHDFVGWTSMYDGNEIDKAEMNEWLDDTIATIPKRNRPSKVLEIGSGTGMILFNLRHCLESYVGLEPSELAVEFIKKTAKNIPALAGMVDMHVATALDLRHLPVKFTADIIILNSVVQYFPSQDYLLNVIREVLEIKDVTTIFLGDIRSYALHREFLAMRALHMAGEDIDMDNLRQMIADSARSELELLVDPGFFTSLPSHFPGRLSHVEIVPKKMRATNELSSYRYAAIVHVKNQEYEDQNVHEIENGKWMDFEEQKLNYESLLQRLRDSDGTKVVPVSNIPYSKTMFSRCLLERLDDAESHPDGDHNWLSSVRQKAKLSPSLSAIELVELGKKANYSVEISWSRQHSQNGGLDAIFHRLNNDGGNKVLFRFPTDHAGRPFHSLSSRPLRSQSLRAFHKPLDESKAVSKEDLNLIWKWNANVPLAVDYCLHEILSRNTERSPDAPAVEAWDGSLTYAELDKNSTRIAYHLIDLGVKPGDMLPLCFESSVWTIVTILAVIKAGAVICMLESTYPQNRLEAIVQEIGATRILCSKSHVGLSSQLVPEAIVVGADTLTTGRPITSRTDDIPRLDPSSLMYIVFTSGSTGSPKGSMISHAAFCSGIFHQASRLGMKPSSRVLNLTNHAFDVFLYNTGATLATGGCLCLPTKDARDNGLSECLVAMNATYVDLTPSLARVLEPKTVPSLQTIVLGGESPSITDIERWRNHATVKNAYGPCETTTNSVINCDTTNLDSATRIGKGAGVVTWVVHPDNHDILLPIGAVGELLLEGPLVGNGYLNDATRTASTFINDPAWLLQGADNYPGRGGRLYKTGDLVRYHKEDDGSLSFIGRKDTQVKIRGQRVELSEVEHRIRQCMPQAAQSAQLAVEIICPGGEATSPMLAVFLSGGTSEHGQPLVMPLAADVADGIAEHLPNYMIPSICFLLSRLPMTLTDKIDRQGLRELGASFSIQQLADLRRDTDNRVPTTDNERQLQTLWSLVLDIDPETISATDNFFRLGGDSIAAMKLVTEARKFNVHLSVAAIFQHPQLQALAQQLLASPKGLDSHIPRFSLLGNSPSIQSDLMEVLASHGLGNSTIEDAYPCSPLQEGLLALTTKRGGDYVFRSVLHIDHNVNIDRFREAWEHTVQLCAILRTRIVYHHSAGLLQLVIKEDMNWIQADSLEDYLSKDTDLPIQLGQPLTRYAIFSDPKLRHNVFVWTIHHALFDAISQHLTLSLLAQLYHGHPRLEHQDYKHFVRHIVNQSSNTAEDFWKSEFTGCHSDPFPPLPLSVSETKADSTMEHFCGLQPATITGITTATLLRAAWALVIQSRSSESDSDVVFGTILSGRNAPVAQIETVIGPTIATVPIRVKINPKQTVAEYLQDTQEQVTRLIPYEQTGLQSIMNMSSETRRACEFQTLLIIHPPKIEMDEHSSLGTWQDMTNTQTFTNYALTFNCELVNGGVRIIADYDSRVLDKEIMRLLLHQYDVVIQALASTESDQTIGDINLLSPRELQNIWNWNSDVPPTVGHCLHHLVEDQAKVQPSALAIHAWDGDFTYGELNDFATHLARYLIRLGVTSGEVLPLSFDKSKWTTVAILAALKTGAAVCLLEPSHPESRLRDIVQNLQAKRILSSTSCASMCTRLVAEVIPVGIDTFISYIDTSVIDKSGNFELPKVDPSSLMYVVFTSGSTGRPKGSMISHAAFCSGMRYQSQQLGYNTTSRVLDCIAHAFDMFIYITGITLTNGGCLCVPSESERLNDLMASIIDMRPTIILTTPSVAQLIDPTRASTLKTIMLVGEVLTRHEIERWWEHCTILNIYGPCEATPLSVINCDATDPITATRIGRGAGVVTWVVHPNNHNQLMPIGSVGELLLEGPLVGNGYLNEPIRTELAFIKDPIWLLHGAGGHPGRNGRLYKTGDLVQYNYPDGTLSFVGRKDTQVKIRGQRVELGEVERHVSEYMSQATEASQIATEVICPGGDAANSLLAVFISNKQSIVDGPSVIPLPTTVENRMAEYLPGYMIPKICFMLPRLPKTSTDKIDRKQLRETGASYSLQQLTSVLSKADGEKCMPATDLEQRLQHLWSATLNIESSSIGVDDSFLRLGGDSIIAMKISFQARLSQIEISTSDILRKKTIRNIASSVSSSLSVQGSATKIIDGYDTEPFRLSPIQQLYFGLQNDTRVCFDQYSFSSLKERITLQELRTALHNIMQRHPMLRARFQNDRDGKWTQRITDDVPNSICVDTLHEYQVPEAISRCRNCLDVMNGPIMAAVLFEGNDNQSLFITIHHLVVDLVSWRIILQDLEDLLLSRPLPRTPSTSFQSWCVLQSEYLAQHLKSQKSSLSRSYPVDLLYWGLEKSTTVSQITSTTSTFLLNHRATKALLNDCNNAFQTRPYELMLATLLYSFSMTFTDRPLPAIFNETHGREPWSDEIDLTQTVGWFTSMFPVHLGEEVNQNLLDYVRRTKDCIRSYPMNGMLHFASRFWHDDMAKITLSEFPVEIAFNYHGLYQQFERDDSFLKTIPIPEGYDTLNTTSAANFALFDIDISIRGGQAIVSFTHDTRSSHQDKILSWIHLYEATLNEVTKLLENELYQWTLSDFPLGFKTYDDLDAFTEKNLHKLGLRKSDIEDIFPCSPMQQGILISQAKDSSRYQACIVFEVLTPTEALDISQLRYAWNAVVQRHSMLRTLLLDDVPGSSRAFNVVLRNPRPSVSIFNATSEAIGTGEFRMHYDPGSRQSTDLQHHLSICQLENGKTYLCLDMNHAIMDAHSQALIMRDLQTAYHHGLDYCGTSYREFITYLEHNSSDEAGQYWRRHLDDVKPCNFPSLSETQIDHELPETIPVQDIDTEAIRKFCLEFETTPATIIQAAWGLVLSRYTGSTTPCFGSLSSGRDVPIHNLSDIVGTLISVLPCRIQLNERRTVLEILRAVYDDYLNSLPHQFYPLASVHQVLGLGSTALFNTVISFQKTENGTEDTESNIFFEPCADIDPTEYDISINALQSETKIEVSITFLTKCLTYDQAQILACYLHKAIHMIIVNPEAAFQNLDITPTEKMTQLWTWNKSVPVSIERCFHQLVEEQAQAMPDAHAIHAWDGKLNYRELNNLATQLAHQLVGLGIKPNDVIPLCFEKSMWTTVALLAVSKAGGVICMLEPSHPKSRLHAVVHQLNAKTVLSSKSYLHLSSQLAPHATLVGPGLIDSVNGSYNHHTLPPSNPSSLMYIVFTSGSTGQPKGVLISHSAFCSAVYYQAHNLGITSTSRVIDLISHSWDVFIYNHGATLANGGCVCVPSESDRRDNLVESITKMSPTFIITTPSMARLARLESIPSMKTVALIGEIVTIRDVERLWDHVTVMNIYGPTECTTLSTMNRDAASPPAATRIGRGAGMLTWIVDPTDHSILVPIGAVGELLLEGPLLGNGYLNDTEKTKAVFIENPPWLLKGSLHCPGRRGRLYKTGDLARYHTDGSLTCLGRKDTQVKIRGQRIELGDVEHHMRDCLPLASQTDQLAAEVITPAGELASPLLAIFLSGQHDIRSPAHRDVGIIDENSISIQAVPNDTENKLAELLPEYMTPAVIFILPYLPMTTTHKIDRKRLREIGAFYPAQLLAEVRSQAQGEKRMPSTEIGHKLQLLYAQVLKLNPQTIGIEDSFFRLGGDSITAMKLVAKAREVDIQLSVADVFRHPRVSLLAQSGSRHSKSSVSALPPFSLLRGTSSGLEWFSKFVASNDLTEKMIEDVYPCSPLQEGLFALTNKGNGDYIWRSVLELSPDIDLDSFCAAWDRTVQLCAILRTRIMYDQDHGLLQVVIKDETYWSDFSTVEEFMNQSEESAMGLGQPLMSYSLIRDPISQRNQFAWTVHHALYDAHSISLTLRMLDQIYHNDLSFSFLDYKYFIRYVSASQDGSAAKSFWTAEFQDYNSQPFPPLPSTVQEPRADSTLEQVCDFPVIVTPDVTVATVVRAAWALVVHSRSCDSDVVFGTTLSGRSAPVPKIEAVIGPTIATIPVRIQISAGQTVSAFLQATQDHMTRAIPYEQSGLQKVATMSSGAEYACGFQTLLVVQPPEDNMKSFTLGTWQDMTDIRGFSNYSLTLNCELTTDGRIRILVYYDSRVLDNWTAKLILDQFDFILKVLANAKPGVLVKDVDTLVPSERRLLWKSNMDVPDTAEKCLHDMFEEQCSRAPAAAAIHAWDGSLTYGELSHMSTRLASHLVNLGVSPGEYIPLCFDKSMWTTVAVLAVLKSGAAICMLESTYPESRLRAIVSDIKAKRILSSRSNHALSSRLVDNPIVVESSLFDQPVMKVGVTTLPKSNPSAVMYIVYTSGSTGVPKGALISHSSFCSGIRHQSRLLGFTETSRVLEFATYAFDMAVHSIGIILTSGGCHCIANNTRNIDDLRAVVTEAKPSIMITTPSLSRLMLPEKIPTLRMLIVGGEPFTVQDADRWWAYTAIANVYGPSECTPLSVINCGAKSPSAATHIGQGVGINTWVVHPDHHDKLMPVGAVGELLLEGPLVGDGSYLNDPVRTSSTFVSDPVWLLQGAHGSTGRHGRLYKTGDLVQYHEDGSLSFVSRKDTQVKIRGQRVELSEVERLASECMPQGTQLAAEVVYPVGEATSPLLAVFISCDTVECGQSHVMTISPEIEKNMAERLPTYMVPSVWLALAQLPMTSTDKVDRKKLRAIGAAYSWQRLAEIRSKTKNQKSMPVTDTEHQLQKIWCHVLGIASSSISVDDSFFRIGGDSIAAIKLVAESRMANIQLSVADVFQYPRLSSMAHQVGLKLTNASFNLPPFSSLRSDTHIVDDLSETLSGHGLTDAMVEDVYPCSALQEALLASTTKWTGDYVLRSTLELSPRVDVERFTAAWKRTVQLTAILRTRIFYHKAHGMLQVVVKDDRGWIQADSLEDYIRQDNDFSNAMGLGQQLTRYCIIRSPESQRNLFVWTMHHALYDSISRSLTQELLSKVYNGDRIPSQLEHKYFIHHIVNQDRDAAAAFWRLEFEGYDGQPFPALPPSVQEPRANSTLERLCDIRAVTTLDITMATIVRAAWALVVYSRSGHPDISFGTAVSGRNAPVPGIETMIAPAIATIPTRIHINSEESVFKYLQKTQEQIVRTIPYEQTGLKQIANTSPETKQASMFQTLLVVHPGEVSRDTDLGGWKNMTSSQAFTSHALTLNCELTQSGVSIVADYDSRVIDDWTVKMVLDQFSLTIQTLATAGPRQIIGDIEMLTSSELEVIWGWNSKLPRAYEHCIHDLFADQARRHPDTMAVHAWDGDLTYSQLDGLATRLACHLMDCGIVMGDVIPLCFDKSMWTTVAILAVLKTGAAICMLDPAHPESRLKAILRQVHAKRIIASTSQISLGSKLSANTIEVGAEVVGHWPNPAVIPMLPPSDPFSLMYVVFTSGSTGVPKGVSIPHVSFCSCILHQIPLLELGPTSRLFDFASHVFDVFVYNTGITLAAGGCLCVPSETGRRNDLSNSISSMSITHALLTPSVARLLEPQQVASMEKIILGGEASTDHDMLRWKGFAVPMNVYGPSECTPHSLINCNTGDQVTTRLGRGAGVVTWIVHQDNHNKLMPLGSVGELLLEGPLLGNGYLDSDRTPLAFIKDPVWLIQGANGHAGRYGRLYKTGDLVHYHKDGSLSFVGRKDTQVKIRGQRVELGEVEHCARSLMPQAAQLVAEVIHPKDNDINGSLLAIFLSRNAGNDNDQLLVMPLSNSVEDKFAEHLPSYMIPTIIFSLAQLPTTSTDKIDRRRLREIGSSYTMKRLADLRSKDTDQKRMPTTDTERSLQKLWSLVLNVELTSIGVDDSFFRLGGDSIAAMKLVAEARKAGVQLAAADIFQHPRLAALGLKICESGPTAAVPYLYKPYTLISHETYLQIMSYIGTTITCIDPSDIEDILPTTSFQQMYLNLYLEQPTMAMNYCSLHLGPHIDIDRFKHACSKLMDCHSILRTIFIPHITRHEQIVLRKLSPCLDIIEVDEDLDTAAQRVFVEDKQRKLSAGSSFLALFLLCHKTLGYRLVFRISHAQYDGVCFPHVVQTLLDAYTGSELTQYPQFSSFLMHAQEQRQKSIVYWRKVLEGSCMTSLQQELHHDLSLTIEPKTTYAQCWIHTPEMASSITVAALVSSAWAFVLGSITNREDVVYGQVVAGRNMAMPDIGKIVGPCVNIIPVRARVHQSQSTADLLNTIQDQITQLGPADSIGLQDIIRECTDWPEQSYFESVVLHIGSDRIPKFRVGDGMVQAEWLEYEDRFFPYINIISSSENDQVRLEISAHSSLLSPKAADNLLDSLRAATIHLASNSAQSLRPWPKS